MKAVGGQWTRGGYSAVKACDVGSGIFLDRGRQALSYSDASVGLSKRTARLTKRFTNTIFCTVRRYRP